MAISRQKKQEIFSLLSNKFTMAKSIAFAKTNTMSVDDFAKFRTYLREVDSTYTVVKKTIIKISLKNALNLDINLSDLEGQIGVLCSNSDSISGLSKANSFFKEINGKKGDLGKIEWSIGIFDGAIKTKQEIAILASIPSRETLLSRFVGSAKSPLVSFVRLLDSAGKELNLKGKSCVGDLQKTKLNSNEKSADNEKEGIQE